MARRPQGSHLRRLRRRLLPRRPGRHVDHPRGGLRVQPGVHPVRGLRADRQGDGHRVRGLRVLEGGKVVGEPRGEFLRRGGSVKGRRELQFCRRAPQRPPGPRPVDDPPGLAAQIPATSAPTSSRSSTHRVATAAGARPRQGRPTLWWKMISRNKRTWASTSATRTARGSSSSSLGRRTSSSRTSAPAP